MHLLLPSRILLFVGGVYPDTIPCGSLGWIILGSQHKLCFNMANHDFRHCSFLKNKNKKSFAQHMELCEIGFMLLSVWCYLRGMNHYLHTDALFKKKYLIWRGCAFSSLVFPNCHCA